MDQINKLMKILTSKSLFSKYLFFIQKTYFFSEVKLINDSFIINSRYIHSKWVVPTLAS